MTQYRKLVPATNDLRPRFYPLFANRLDADIVPMDWKKCDPSELKFEVWYAIPVLNDAKKSEFKRLSRTFRYAEDALAFLNQKLASYNCRRQTIWAEFVRSHPQFADLNPYTR